MKSTFLLLLTFAFLTTVVKADHGAIGSVGNLQWETRELLQTVNSSWLNYNVKDSVYRFASDVDRLANCVMRESDRDSTTDNHLEDPGCPSQCSYYLNYANNSFRSVSNYLYDTYKDFPQVYYQWRETDNALRTIHVIQGPGPNPNMVSCVAVDTGWEEHSGGHIAYGANIQYAQQAAYNLCRRYHGSCRISSCRTN